jgi:hypothetical protein
MKKAIFVFPAMLLITLLACNQSLSQPPITAAPEDPITQNCPPDAELGCGGGGSGGGGGQLPGPINLKLDNDHDGIVDIQEDLLASNFMPWVWFDHGENYSRDCTHPATFQSPGTVLARVRLHPYDSSKIAITYSVLYRKDCGDFLGFTSHRGDVETFTLTLAPNSSCPMGYGAFAIKTTAHEGTITETREEAYLGNDCTWGRRAGGDQYTAKIFSSENKHGNYLSLARCDSGALGTDHCSYGFTLDFRVFNVGEDAARRFDLMGWTQGFPEEYVWTPVDFCGTLGHQYGKCAGLIRNKLLNDSLLARAF